MKEILPLTTGRGIDFNILNPEAKDVNIEDIATSLAKLVRYNGQCSGFWSVADHSLLVADYILFETKNPRMAMVGLLHDAAEAYIGDIPTGVKQSIEKLAGRPVIKMIEAPIVAAIAEAFELDPQLFNDPLIKKVDLAALKFEWCYLMKRDLEDYPTLKAAPDFNDEFFEGMGYSYRHMIKQCARDSISVDWAESARRFEEMFWRLAKLRESQ